MCFPSFGMYNLIAPSLFQKRICRLPGLGSLQMVSHSAETHFIDREIRAPYDEIRFIPNNTDEASFNEFSAISQLIRQDLQTKGEVVLDGVGVFYQSEDGLEFAPVVLDAELSRPVQVEFVTREDTRHSLLVGDQETTTDAMDVLLNKPTFQRTISWWWWALLILLFGITGLVLYYLQTGDWGNASFSA